MSADLHGDLIPDEAVRYILLQRTALLKTTRLPAYVAVARHVPNSVYQWIVTVESRLRRGQVKSAYVADMQAEYSAIRQALPKRCSAIMDIGCGIAGIDVLLARHYADHAPSFVLIDKTATDRLIHYGFAGRGAFYNSLSLAGTLLEACGVNSSRVTLAEVGDAPPPPVPGGVDLVISLISWGFHYPVSTYLDYVDSCLSAEGTLIMDVRRDSGGLEQLKQRFDSLFVLSSSSKADRIVARKGAGSTP